MTSHTQTPRVAIVTGCDEGFLDFLEGWLGSLLAHRVNEIARLYVFDCGLTERSRDAIATYGVTVLQAPSNPYPIPDLPQYYIAQMLRPDLSDLIQDTEYILWIDADCWMQERTVVEAYLSVAAGNDIACCVEQDRSYSAFGEDITQPQAFKDGEHNVPLFEKWTRYYDRFYPGALSRQLAAYPMINGGVFCAKVSSPMWAIWKEELHRLMGYLVLNISSDPYFRRMELIADQTALNKVVRVNDLSVGYLPATCNWVTHRALPLFDEESRLLRERCWPHDPIKIIHLTGAKMKEKREFPLQLFGAAAVHVSERLTSLRSPFSVPI